MACEFTFVPLDLAIKFESLAAERGVSKVARGVVRSTQSDGGFFQVAKRVGGSVDALKRLPIKKASRQTWWQRRNNFCQRHRGQMLVRREPLLETSGRYKGTPTRRELGMLMWMCSSLTQKELQRIAQMLHKKE